MSTDGKEVFQSLCEVISEVLKVDGNQLMGTIHFVEDLGVDSLDSVELLMATEVKFGITIEDDLLEKIQTIDDAVSLVADLIVENENDQKKRQEERARELDASRLVWKALEEKSGKAFVERTGYPYLVYDRVDYESTDDSDETFHEGLKQAVEGGYYKDWFMKVCSAFLGEEITDINLDVATSVIALLNMLRLEDEMSRIIRYSKNSRWHDYSAVMTKDGVVHDKTDMILDGDDILLEILNRHLLHSFKKVPFKAICSKKKGDMTPGTVTADFIYMYDGEFYVSFSALLDGKKKPINYDAYIDLLANKWVFNKGKSFITSYTGKSGRIFNSINDTLAKVKKLAEMKLILEYASYKLGIDAKTITLTLAKNILKINHAAARGNDISFKDGRSYPGYNLVSASSYLLHKCLSHLISNMNGSVQLLVDGEVKQFFPKEYITADLDKKTVALTGTEVSERGIERKTYDLSLIGKKSYLAREDIRDVIHLRQVTVGDDSRTRECLNEIAFLLRRLS